MKKLILLALMSAYAMSSFTNEAEIKAIETAKENDRLCKIFTNKADRYEVTMRNDSLAEATLVSYKERRNSFCNPSTVTAAVSEIKTIAEVEPEIKALTSRKEDARLCNVFTKKVKKYESTMRDDSLAKATLVSYKQRMSAYCGTLVVKS